MKALKIIGNIFGVLFSVVLSLILVALLIVMPIISAASSFTQPETLGDVIENIDYIELIKANPEVSKSLEEMGVTGELMQDVLESDVVEDLIEVYVDDFLSSLDGNTESKLNVDTLKSIVDDNMEELVPLVKQFMAISGEGESGATDGQIKAMIEDVVAQYGGDLIAMLPSPQDLGLVPPGMSPGNSSRTVEPSVPTEETIGEMLDAPADAPVDQTMVMVFQIAKKLHNGTIMMALIASIAIISLLIVLFRWPRFKGFMWLGVDYILAAGISFLVASSVGVVIGMAGIPVELQPVIASVSGALVANLTKVAAIEAGLAVLFIAVFVVGRILLKKYKAKKLAPVAIDPPEQMPAES